MKIKIKHLRIENFKGIKGKVVDFTDKTSIKGQNASGKTTLFDAFTWLLFNKNSAGVEKFDARPLDANGKQIDNVEIKVVATLDVDGKEVELSKTQKQKWVKKRGSEARKFEGNENSFEIDGYPMKSESDFKAYVSNMVNEDLFKMLTNPQYFPAMKWKEQRDILMRFVSDFSDLDIADRNKDKYAELIPELEKAPSTDDIKAKFTKALSEWKKKQVEIPTRIDEVSKQKVDIDAADLELQKKALEEKITSCDEKLKSANKVIDELEQKKFNLQFEINDCKRKANEFIIKERVELQKKRFEAEENSKEIHNKIRNIEQQIFAKGKEIENLEREKKELGEQYFANKKEEFSGTLDFDESKWVFDENSTVCSLCGQTLPEDRIEKLKSEFEIRKSDAKEKAEKKLENDRLKFEKSKKDEMKKIVALGNEKKNWIESLSNEIKGLEEKLPGLKNEEIQQNGLKDKFYKELEEFPSEADLSSNAEYAALMKKDAEYSEQIATARANCVGVDTDAIGKERRSCVIDLEIVKEKIASVANNVQIDERIRELEEEQRSVGQKVADQEKMLYLLEEFVREKMNLVSDSINSKFESVTFSLFENQINGGMKEKCEVMYDGVPYASLNSGHRIVAGLDIINALQKLYGISAPIFIDNAESLNDFNLPKMDCQLIALSVSDDKEMVVE